MRLQLQPAKTTERLSQGKLLIVDDESSIRWALRLTLQNMGFDVSEAGSGDEAIALIRTVQFNVVLLDVCMPGMNGVEACREIRNLFPEIGIVMLTVSAAEKDRTDALGAGADDYITKPFHVQDLAARIRALMRRADAAPAVDAIIRIGDIELRPSRRFIMPEREPIRLTRKEYDLLHCLMTNAGSSVTHVQLLDAVWGPEYSREVLRTYIRRLRKKLGDDAVNPRYLLTDARGYRFNAEL